MNESTVPPPAQPFLWLQRVKAMPYHGLLVFLGQILLLVLIPVFDQGGPTAPLQQVMVASLLSLLTLVFLGYRRLSLTLGIIGALALLWEWGNRDVTLQSRAPLIASLAATYVATAYLSVQYAFSANLRPSQRILCGAASFVMIGFVFAFAHGLVFALDLGRYNLSATLEAGRSQRYVDFLWLSFSTLTTAGFSDMSPVGSWPCAVAALEGLCGILYPATLIARITSMPAAGESEKGCW